MNNSNNSNNNNNSNNSNNDDDHHQQQQQQQQQQQEQQQQRPILIFRNYQINIIVVGNQNTGKSELLNGYCEYTGISVKRSNLEIKLKRIIKDDRHIRFRFYDVGEFYEQLNSYLGAIFVYDTTDYQSFINIKNHYYQDQYLNSRKSNIFVINNKDSIDKLEEEYSTYLLNSSGSNSGGDDRMDELFFKVFRNLYLRSLIFSFKKKDIIIKYLIGTKLDLKNKFINNNNNNNNNSCDNSESESESESTLKTRYVTTKEGKELANKMGAKFYQVSSIQDLHIINEIFSEFTDKVLENYELYAQDTVLESLINNRTTTFHADGSSSTIINQNNILTPPSLSTVNKNRNNLSSIYWRTKCSLN